MRFAIRAAWVAALFGALAATSHARQEQAVPPTAEDFRAGAAAVAKENVEARRQRDRQPKDGNINDAVWGTKRRSEGPADTAGGSHRDAGSVAGKAGTR